MNINILIIYASVLLFTISTLSRAESGKIDLEELTKKAQAGDPQSQYDLGMIYDIGNEVDRDPEVAFGWFLKAAQGGHAEAQFTTGQCYFYGDGITKDKSLGASWYYEAAMQDHIEAIYALGDCYFRGEGVERNHAESINWFSKAATKGEQGAKFRIAKILETGDPSVRNPLKAFEGYQKSARDGDSHAEYLVGKFYEEGRIAPRDIARALQSYNKAAPNSELARAKLAKLYARGEGVEVDPVEAYKWMETTKRIVKGDQTLQQLKVELESILTPAQRKAAAAKVETYIKQHNIEQYSIIEDFGF